MLLATASLGGGERVTIEGRTTGELQDAAESVGASWYRENFSGGCTVVKLQGEWFCWSFPRARE